MPGVPGGAELSAKGFSAFHIMAGLPDRGTETTSIRFRNTKLASRNVFIRDGQVIIIVVISYTKARASTNHAFYIVRCLPDVGVSVLLYLAYIRPFLDFLAGQPELPHYQSSGFLFADPKHKTRHLGR